MASADVRDELLCSICLSIYTDPVTLRCGHNFCRICIDRVLDTQDGSGVYSCPECKGEFQERPALRRNMDLNNVAEHLLSTQPGPEEITEICCTYCIHSPVPAVRSCLMCEASLCDNHLRVHSKEKEHVLTEPSTNLENWKCSVHKELLKYYCTEHNICICVSCSLAGDHRGHQVEMLDEASEKKKKKLRNVLKKLITKREKTEERVRSLEEHRRKAQEKASGEAKRVTALFIDIRRRLDDLEKRVLSEISRQENKISLPSSALIHQLEIQKDELCRKMRHIEELCNMTDPLTFLQDPDTGDLCGPEEEGGDEDTGGDDGDDEDTKGDDGGDQDTGGHDGGDEHTVRHYGDDEDTGGHDGGDDDTMDHDGGDEHTMGHNGGDEEIGRHDKTHDIDVDVITRMLHAGFSDITSYLQTISPTTPRKKRKRSPSVGSPPSVRQDLPLSGRKKRGDVIVRTGGVGKKVMGAIEEGIYGQGPADILLDVYTAADNLLISDNLKTVTKTKQNHPELAKRFQYPQVMSVRGFSSGRHYWDVEISGSLFWMVGMCYPSMDRRGRQSLVGNNNKSWCLSRFRVDDNYNQYSVIHDSKTVQLGHQISSDRFRICLDYEAGQLSFYELCDPIRHLHTFTTTFTEPLHAVLCVCGGSMKISGMSHHHSRNLPGDL